MPMGARYWTIGVIESHSARPLEGDDDWDLAERAPTYLRNLLNHVEALEAERDALKGEVDACHAIMDSVRQVAQQAVGDGEHRMTIDAARMMSDRIGMLEKSVISLLENCQFETDAEGHVTRVEMDFHGAVHVFIPSQPWHDPMMAHIARLWSLVQYRGNPADFSYVAY
jgi:hypothetical protein